MQCGQWTVVCGMWCVDTGLWPLACSLLTVVCGLRFVVCGHRVSGLWISSKQLMNANCFRIPNFIEIRSLWHSMNRSSSEFDRGRVWIFMAEAQFVAEFFFFENLLVNVLIHRCFHQWWSYTHGHVSLLGKWWFWDENETSKEKPKPTAGQKFSKISDKMLFLKEISL